MSNIGALIRAMVPTAVKGRLQRAQLFLHSGSFRIANCRVNGLSIKLGISSQREAFRALTYPSKEPETLDWLETHLRDGDTFFDVGANIGVYSLFAATLRPNCLVYSFEPESQNFARLCKNIVLNKLTNVIPCSVSVSDRESFGSFLVGEIQAGAALHSFGKASGFRSVAPVLKQGSLSCSLDGLMTKYGLPCPSLLKIDVDGIETEILGGAAGMLSCSTLRTVLVELSYPVAEVPSGDKSCAAGVFGQMARSGLKLVGKSDWVWESGGMKAQNFIFARDLQTPPEGGQTHAKSE